MTLSRDDRDVLDQEQTNAVEDEPFLRGFLEHSSVTQHEAGLLHVPSGRIVACDPACYVEPAFQRTIPPGRYRVVAGTVDTAFEGRRVAYLVLWVKDTPIVREERAYLDGRDAFQYGVDAGLGCFVDATLAPTARAAVRAAIDARDAVVWHDGWNYLNYQVGQGNVVMCRSGFGDGYYATYVGLDAHGDVVCFVSDFGVIQDDAEDDESAADSEE